jgi:hypothetical protein
MLLSAKSLEPASSAVPNAADKQHYDDNDQKSCGVHVVLLLGDKRGPRGQGIPNLRLLARRFFIFNFPFVSLTEQTTILQSAYEDSGQCVCFLKYPYRSLSALALRAYCVSSVGLFFGTANNFPKTRTGQCRHWHMFLMAGHPRQYYLMAAPLIATAPSSSCWRLTTRIVCCPLNTWTVLQLTPCSPQST